MLKIGEIIKGSFWPEIVVIKDFEEIDDDLYLVESIGRKTNKYYEQYLDKSQLSQVENIQEEESTFNAERLQHYLQYYILKTEEKYSQSRARGNKKIIPLPHQIEAVYSRMLQSPQVRYLLADDPGAGKTIMSGMLIRELIARQAAERVLILVPPLVLKQWQEELKEKFGEDFTIIQNLSETMQIEQLNPMQSSNVQPQNIYNNPMQMPFQFTGYPNNQMAFSNYAPMYGQMPYQQQFVQYTTNPVNNMYAMNYGQK